MRASGTGHRTRARRNGGGQEVGDQHPERLRRRFLPVARLWGFERRGDAFQARRVGANEVGYGRCFFRREASGFEPLRDPVEHGARVRPDLRLQGFGRAAPSSRAVSTSR